MYAAPTSCKARYAVRDAVSKADAPTAAPTAHTSTPVLIPRAVTKALRRPSLSADRSTSAVSSPGVMVTNAATAAKETTDDHLDTQTITPRHHQHIDPIRALTITAAPRRLERWFCSIGGGGCTSELFGWCAFQLCYFFVEELFAFRVSRVERFN
jgi:hypothetical protein